MDQQPEISIHKQDLSKPVEDVANEVLQFPTFCGQCGELGQNKVYNTTIPFVKEITIMSFNCEVCGFKENEVKPTSEITPKGKQFKLNVTTIDDLKREVFKSDTSSLIIPEIELELSNGTLGGVYSTIQGLVVEILDHLRDHNPFVGDDTSFFNEKMEWIFGKLEGFQEGKEPFTIIIRDLVDKSFISVIDTPESDINLKVEEFIRTADDDDLLGIDTMQTEDYA